MTKLFPQHIVDFISENAKGLLNDELTMEINKKFGTNYEVHQIRNYKHRHHITSGFTCCFEKGHVPYNKGKKMTPEMYERAKPTMFKKGNIPQNHRPVGSERISKDGYIEIKIAEPSKWQLKHRYLWEQTNGKIPKGHIVIFLNQNKLDVRLENLACISKQEHLQMINKHRYSQTSEITQSGVLVTRLGEFIREKIGRKYPIPRKRVAELIELKKRGLTREQIMEIMNIQKRTYHYYLSIYKNEGIGDE